MISYKDHCSFLEESVKCSVLSDFGSAPLKCLRYAFVAITVERFIAMCCYQQYEKWKYPIALTFLPLTWVEIPFVIRHIVLTLSQSENIYQNYCFSVIDKVMFNSYLAFHIPLLRLGIPMGTLSSRYQIRENMKTSKTMFIATIIVEYMRNKIIKWYFGCRRTNRVGEELMSSNQPLSVQKHIEIIQQMWEKAHHK
ncbi:hypothetical protein DINM_005678 [Dirofilaria immitis]|nr:hypothetical protein [Dirofilaria immitis]